MIKSAVQQVKKTLTTKATAFFKDIRGGMMTTTAVMMPVLIGFCGVGLDLTNWYMEKRIIQNLVDSGSLMAAHSVTILDQNELGLLVSEHLNNQGLTGDDTLTVTNPPSAGIAIGRNGFVEVTIRRPAQALFLSYFGFNNVTVEARAVAGKLVIGDQCIVALDETVDRALNFTGTATVNADCGVMSNSSSSEAIYIGGSASLTADPAQAHGDILVSGSATLITNSPMQTFTDRLEDPYADLVIPPGSSCDFGPTNTSTNDTLTPGRYCGDISVQGTNVTFEPGTYIIDGGDFNSNANAEFAGTGVTFILTGNSPSDIGNVTMNGNTDADLSAPTSGDYMGILFYQDPRAIEDSTGNANKFNGGADLTLDGVVYFPSQGLTFTGGASASPACLQIIGKSVTFVGDSNIGSDSSLCTSYGIDQVDQERVQIVE